MLCDAGSSGDPVEVDTSWNTACATLSVYTSTGCCAWVSRDARGEPEALGVTYKCGRSTRKLSDSPASAFSMEMRQMTGQVWK